MILPARLKFRAGAVLGLLTLCAASPALAQQTLSERFVTGRAQQMWDRWQPAMQALLERGDEPARVEEAFGALFELDPSPLRLALLADYTVKHTSLGGALLLFDQDAESGALGPNGQRVAQALATGREQMSEADDGWYFCQIGRFDVANANFTALLASKPDPAALLEFADRVPRRREVLLQLIDNPTVGPAIRGILGLLEQGERAAKSDPQRIRENIERLGGTPRGFDDALQALKDSGEQSVPFFVQYLRDPKHADLLRPIVAALPQIDRPALNPLVMALRMQDEATKLYVVQALGQIGYAQAVPYLLQVRQDGHAPQQIRDAADAALQSIARRSPSIAIDLSVAAAFYQLGEQYYGNTASLAADPRLNTANVWYWRDDILLNIEVPTEIFNEVMTMRCCEEALRAEPGHKEAIALWLAANFRREAQLPPETTDQTRPENFPPAAYFAQAAGAEYCLLALARAVSGQDPVVGLGTIGALRKTAGPAALLAFNGERSPLAESLSFADRLVRIRAGLALANARPTSPFQNYQNLMPVLNEALMLHGGARNALLVDPDDASANYHAGLLRELGYEVLTDSSLLRGLEKVRGTLPGLDIVLIASDVQAPPLTEALATLRGEFQFAATPVVLIARPGGLSAAESLSRGDPRLGLLPANSAAPALAKVIADTSRAAGTNEITPELGAQLALEATEALRLLALTDNPLFNIADTQAALLATLSTDKPDLRLAAVEALGFLGSRAAQEAIGAIALDGNEPEPTRVEMFRALATAAKRRGNQLGDEMIKQIVQLAENEPNMVIREAASETLGALNVAGEPASTIIRNQYRG